MWACGSSVGIEKRSMGDGKDAGFYVELQSTGSRDFKRVVLRPPRTTYFPGAFFMCRCFFLLTLFVAFRLLLLTLDSSFQG